MKMTAAKAIRLECKWCSGAVQSKCNTKICQLHPSVSELRSSVKRIKAHCLDCAAQDIGETKSEAAASCKGDLLRENGNTVRWVDGDGIDRGVCFLHPYRFGKNPTRKPPKPEHIQKLVAAGKETTFRTAARCKK